MAKYRGKITTTGKSQAFRFEVGLFNQNPEFKQQAKVEGHIIGPGQMLVSVVDEIEATTSEDPITLAFLAFLEKDMKEHPERLAPVPAETITRARELTKGVAVSDDDAIGDDVTI